MLSTFSVIYQGLMVYAEVIFRAVQNGASDAPVITLSPIDANIIRV